MKLIKFEDTQLQLKEDTKHEFLLTNKEVAQGYGVSITTIRSHLSKNSDELIEGKHWLKLEVATKGGKQKVIHWTKRGIIRLGFFIKSQRAKKFRDFIEDLTIRQTHQPQLIEDNCQIEELIKRSDIVRGYQGQIAKLENELAKKQSDIKNLELQLSRPFELSGVKELLEVARQKDKKFQTLQLERNETINTIEKIVFPHIEKIENSIKALKEINSSLYRFLITN